MINKNSKIYIAGHNGFVGSALLKDMQNKGYGNLIIRSKSQLDLLNQEATYRFLKEERPEAVILCAARVGGILPNSLYPAEFLYENLQIELNIIHGAYLAGVKKLIFLGSSCIYPRNCPQPIVEEYLLTGELEPTNYGYAIAKAAGIKACQAYNQQYGTNFISLNPSNLYGPGDNFDPETSHALAAIMRKVHLVKIGKEKWITLWGTGKSLREWLFVEDLADIVEQILIMEEINDYLLNIGLGKDLSILDLTRTILKVLDVNCAIDFDSSKPDGTPRKLLDISKMRKYGLEATTGLEEGIKKTYDWFLKKA